MHDDNALAILTWQDIRQRVHALNPTIAEAIDELDPGDECKLIHVRYPFGQHILKNGELYLPHEGQYQSVHSTPLKDALTYNPLPAGIVIKNSAELYADTHEQIMPFNFMPEGYIFALTPTLQESSESNYSGIISNMTSGARSLYMVPKIADLLAFNRLSRTLHLHIDLPRHFQNHWDVLVAIANSKAFGKPWESEMLFFSKEWFEHKTEPRFRLFREALFNLQLRNTESERNQLPFDIVFSLALAEHDLKLNPFLIDTLKHIYTIANGIRPGFSFAHDEKAAPIAQLQQIMNDIYDLKYAPSIMHPDYLTHQNAVFYLLSIPTLLSFSPKSQKKNSIYSDLRDLATLTRHVNHYILNTTTLTANTPMRQLAEQTQFEYFHSSKPSPDGIVQSIQTLATQQKALQAEVQRFNKPFCAHSALLRGCIKITK